MTTDVADPGSAPMTLRERLADWHDVDSAMYELGRSLGLFNGGSEQDLKWAFESARPLGDTLHGMLVALVDAGVLESRDDDQFRWRGDPTVGFGPTGTLTEPEVWELLRGLDEPLQRGRAEGWETPTAFDGAAAQARFDLLGVRLGAGFGIELPRVRGPEQDAAFFGVHRIPASATSTREERGVSVVMSNFGNLATYHASGAWEAPPVSPDDASRVEAALTESGCRLIPFALLRTPYDGVNADNGVTEWYERFFAYP